MLTPGIKLIAGLVLPTLLAIHSAIDGSPGIRPISHPAGVRTVDDGPSPASPELFCLMGLVPYPALPLWFARVKAGPHPAGD
jgi:hypothetical protein